MTERESQVFLDVVVDAVLPFVSESRESLRELYGQSLFVELSEALKKGVVIDRYCSEFVHDVPDQKSNKRELRMLRTAGLLEMKPEPLYVEMSTHRSWYEHTPTEKARNLARDMLMH